MNLEKIQARKSEIQKQYFQLVQKMKKLREQSQKIKQLEKKFYQDVAKQQYQFLKQIQQAQQAKAKLTQQAQQTQQAKQAKQDQMIALAKRKGDLQEQDQIMAQAYNYFQRPYKNIDRDYMDDIGDPIDDDY
jgi:predicted  nucleic acid-binding Zn-ribbon protein